MTHDSNMTHELEDDGESEGARVLDPPAGSSDPFASQTRANTGSHDWLSHYDDIKANFSSLSEYAANMVNAATDLTPAIATLSELPRLINEGFGAAIQGPGQAGPSGPTLAAYEGSTGAAQPFYEALVAAQYVGDNFKDLSSMLGDLSNGLQNMGYAAQTVVDSYHLTDDGNASDLSRISVDGVDFAFGMGGKRPAGLDKRIGETSLEQTQDAEAKAAKQAQKTSTDASDAAGNPDQAHGRPSIVYTGPPDDPISRITTTTYPDGSSIRVEESLGPGPRITTTEVIGPKGQIQSGKRETTTTSGGTTTVVTEKPDKNGTFHESSRQVTTTTTNRDGAKVTTVKTTKVQGGRSTPDTTVATTENVDGSTETDTTTYAPKKGGGTTSQTQRLAVGDNDNDLRDQKGANDPKAVADKDDAKLIRPVMQ